ncbi:MAG: DUF2723 domain-containing protein [Candidatus Hydrogenedentes bacterium]|nr:DUF2723 domain-containing protein [Candidatus Hydrogenedentota bacterium]
MGVLVLAVYITTLGPTVTGEDSGELITAAYTLGIAHPPGYPIWCLLGKLFTFIPYGTIAWRVAFMSAFFGAAAAAVACRITIHITESYIGGIAAGLLMGFSKEYWEQSVISEVYSLNAFFLLLCVLILLIWIRRQEPRLLYALAIVYGLGLANHNTMHFVGPIFVLAVFAVDRRPWLHWQRYCTLGGIALGTWMLINLYLPIRSYANPPVDWGNPETWQGFWDVVLRQQYSFGFKKNPHSFSRLIAQVWTLTKLYGREFTPWLAILPLLGLYPLWKRHRAGFLLIAGLFVYITAGFLFILNFNVDKESIWVNNVFFIPVYIMAAILMGSAIAALAQTRVRGFRLQWPAAFLAVCLPVLPLSTNYYWNDKSDYWFAHDYGVNIFRTMDEGAVYFPIADHATFPLIYLQSIEGMRPDVIIANKYGYPEELFYEEMPYELRTFFSRILSEEESGRVEDWIVDRGDRPVYFTRKRNLGGKSGAVMENAGLIYIARRPGESLEKRDFWSDYTWHTLDPHATRAEYTAEAVVSDYYFFHARAEFKKNHSEQGLRDLQVSLELAGKNKEALNNIGSACAEYGQLDPAADYFQQALELDPDYTLALENCAKVFMQKKEFAKALPILKRVVAIEPEKPANHWMMAQCQKETGAIEEALSTFIHLADMTPNDARVYREIGMRYLNNANQPELARRYFTKSLQLNPDQPDLMQMLADNRGLTASPSMPEPPNTPSLPDIPVPQVGNGNIAPPTPPVPKTPSLPDIPIPEVGNGDIAPPTPPMPETPSLPNVPLPEAGNGNIAPPTPPVPEFPNAPPLPSIPMPEVEPNP